MTQSSKLSRRESIWMLGALSLAAMTGPILSACASRPGAEGTEVKFSRGTQHPRTELPANATDCHHHIYDSRYPVAPNASLRPADALVSDYRELQRRIGTTRNVVVQPSTYGVDNRLLVDSLKTFGLATTRGIAVVNATVTEAELRNLHAVGVRGIRFNLAPPGTTTLDMVRPLAARIQSLGWHIQVNAPADALLAAKSVWADLPVPVVFDHLGRIPQPGALQNPTFAMIRELLQRDKAWVKLSGFYNESVVGQPTYSDSVAVASVYAKEAPERVVWGSDWPHPTEKDKGWPDDALLVDLLALAVPTESARHRVLVENPARLYQFD